MANNTYLFARFHLLASYQGDKTQYILKGLETPTVLVARGSKWGFYKVETIELDGELFIAGYLVKYLSTVSVEVADEKEHVTAKHEIENYIRAQSRFFMHVETGAIAYHEVSNEIGEGTFRKRFAKLFETAYKDLLVEVELVSINEEKGVLNLLKRAEKIISISTRIYPSNPNINPIWKEIDDDMKKRNITSRKEKIESDKPGGIIIEGSDEIEARIAMTEDGYGSTQARVILDGEPHVLSTYERSVSSSIPDEVESASSILGYLRDTFTSIQKRFE
jgi:hypothetical protein